MSNIKELLDRLCPDGVPFKPLGEICDNICSGGTPLTSVKEYYKGNIPWLRTQEVDWNDVYDTDIKISDKAVSNSSAKLIPANCVIVAMYGATAAKCCINKIPLATNQACCNLEINPQIANYRYVYHWICKNYTVLKSMGEGSQSNLNAAKIRNFAIPIPPIEVQEEIVRILDKFSACVAELQKALKEELQARKEQYEYYRNLLLTFKRDDDAQETNVTPWGGADYKIVWKTLGEVCEKTHKIKWKENSKKNYFYIDLTSVDCDTHKISSQLTMIDSLTAPSRAQQIVITNDVLFGTTRPTLMRFTIVPPHLNDQICSTGFAILRANTKIILPKYLYYILNTNRFLIFVDKNQEGAGYPSISSVKLNKYVIPIPPIEVQEKIVGVLDRFEALVNDLTQGLPAEIAAQQERYGYYRNKLLTFKEQK